MTIAPARIIVFALGQEQLYRCSVFGQENKFRVRANYRPTAKFSISVSETWDRFRLPLPNGNFSVALASLQGNYSFSRFLTFASLKWIPQTRKQPVPICA